MEKSLNPTKNHVRDLTHLGRDKMAYIYKISWNLVICQMIVLGDITLVNALMILSSFILMSGIFFVVVVITKYLQKLFPLMLECMDFGSCLRYGDGFL